MVKNQNCVIWIQIHCIYKKHMIFTSTLQNMLKPDLLIQIINYIDHYLKKNLKK